MILYRTLRRLTLALRSLQVGLLKAQNAAALGAENAGVAAKAAALSHLDRTENKARDRVILAIEYTEQVMEKLLDAEDAAQVDYEEVCYRNSDIRSMILTEVL